MTDTKSTDTSTDRQTMADVDHVHEYDPGASVRFYSRGPAAMTDGGDEATEPDEEADEERAEESCRMKDVDHTPPNEDREVNRVFERGGEGRMDDE